MAEQGFIESDGAQIAWRTDGEGPQVLLVHAGGCDARMWTPVTDLLSRRHRVIRFDLRGHGGSTFPPGEFSNTRDLLAVVGEVANENEPLAVAASSFGGLVALEAALEAPHRFQALLLLAPALRGHRWSPESLEYWDAEESRVAAGDLEGAIELGIERHAASLDDATQQLVRAMQRRAFELQVGVDATEREPSEATADRLHELDVKTLVAVGENDYSDFHAIADRITQQVPHARSSILPGCGHLIPFECPRETAGLLNELAGAS